MLYPAQLARKQTSQERGGSRLRAAVPLLLLFPREPYNDYKCTVVTSGACDPRLGACLCAAALTRASHMHGMQGRVKGLTPLLLEGDAPNNTYFYYIYQLSPVQM